MSIWSKTLRTYTVSTENTALAIAGEIAALPAGARLTDMESSQIHGYDNSAIRQYLTLSFEYEVKDDQ